MFFSSILSRGHQQISVDRKLAFSRADVFSSTDAFQLRKSFDLLVENASFPAGACVRPRQVWMFYESRAAEISAARLIFPPLMA